jgi:hypothetical protein
MTTVEATRPSRSGRRGAVSLPQGPSGKLGVHAVYVVRGHRHAPRMVKRWAVTDTSCARLRPRQTPGAILALDAARVQSQHATLASVTTPDGDVRRFHSGAAGRAPLIDYFAPHRPRWRRQ